MSGSPGLGAGEEGLHRRKGDLTESGTLIDMLTLLMSRPSCDGIAKHLVLRVMRVHDARSALISIFGVDGSLHEVGMFGLSDAELEDVRCLSLGHRTPLTDAARTGEAVILPTAAIALERYPWLTAQWGVHDPMAAWPLILPAEFVGAVQFTFRTPADEFALHADVPDIAAVLALYLSLLDPGSSYDQGESGGEVGRGLAAQAWRSQQGLDVAGLANSAIPVSSSHRPNGLTGRQLRILELLAEGRSHAEISTSIGFSESTVRHESMAIYRYLGAADRREAVRRALLRGLLAAPDL